MREKNDKKVLILGAYGYLGSILSSYLNKKYKVLRVGRKKKSEIIIKKIEEIKSVILKYKPSIIINLIACADVEKCEKMKNIAIYLNIKVLNIITQAINKIGKKNCHLIHISTDQVYSGNGNHNEKNPRPINFYGKTKLLGEKEVLKINATILRTNFIGRNTYTKKKTLSDWIINCAKNNVKINCYTNIFFSPLHTSTLCKFIKVIIKKKICGIYNLGSVDKISKAEYATKLLKLLKFNEKIISLTKYSRSNVNRPLDMSLNTSKFQRLYKIKLPNVKNEIYKNSIEYLKEKNVKN
jgi:dTDP-4-dehydrorhamnose reductase